MSEEKKPLLSDLTQDLGIGATATAAITALWTGGWWQWIPAALVLGLGVYTLVLERPLPWHITLYKDLQQLNAGTSNHPLLQRVIRRTLESMLLNGLVQVGSRKSDDTALKASRWLRTMTYANQRLDHWIGRKIWSYSTFDRLLLMAVAYPLLLFLAIWWWTGLGGLGPTEILPPLSSGVAGWGLRSLVLMLMLWPLACLWLYGQTLRPPGDREGWWMAPAFMLTTLVPSLVMAALVTKSAHLNLAFASGVFGVIATTVGLLGIGTGLGVGTAAVAVAGVSALIGAISTASAATLSSTGTWAVAVAAAGAILVVVINPTSESKLTQNEGSRSHRLVLTLVSSIGAFLLLITALPLVFASFTHPMSIVPGIGALLLFSLGWMPLTNACFDWLSLGITRELLRRMTRSPIWMWGGMLLDLIAGVVLTLGLLWLAFQILALMQWSGWPVDAQAMRATFIANPLDPQVSWLAMLAVTNLLPTIWHLGVSLWGLVDRQFTTPESLKESLIKLNDFMDDKGNPKPGALAPGLGELDLQTVYHSLFVHPWLYVGTVVTVVVGLWGSYVQALRWTLTWLP